MNRILVIRGGAIGDFILTLPALRALRVEDPGAQIEILGYKQIAALAENRFYAQAIHSIEYGPLSSFFAKNSELSLELASYFASFDVIISYLYDPDSVFESNLRRCHARKIVPGPARIDNSQHAARQLARPMEQLGIQVKDFAAQLYPSNEDRDHAGKFLADRTSPIVALHPGSGSEKKNWPLEFWVELGSRLLNREDFPGTVVIVAGEADENRTTKLNSVWKDPRVLLAKNLPLPQLAAILEHAIFVGHDSGISHLAAAAGASCTLLFGPTDPSVWAPLNENVRVIYGAGGNIDNIQVREVQEALPRLFRSQGKSASGSRF
jgi:heptosyltransferase III